MSDREILELILKKIDTLDTRIDTLDTRFNTLDTRLENLEQQVSEIKEDTEITRTAVNYNGQKLEELVISLKSTGVLA